MAVLFLNTDIHLIVIAPKNALTMAMLTCKLLLIVIVASGKFDSE